MINVPVNCIVRARPKKVEFSAAAPAEFWWFPTWTVKSDDKINEFMVNELIVTNTSQ